MRRVRRCHPRRGAHDAAPTRFDFKRPEHSALAGGTGWTNHEPPGKAPPCAQTFRTDLVTDRARHTVSRKPIVLGPARLDGQVDEDFSGATGSRRDAS